ncbi:MULTISPECIES: protein translocase subunit SecF [Methanohalophilus]|jgi:preprotein translocase subunit SecF|uniref:Protein-export membrane protein SecF n=1 Tax=Methanohalophilus euhalobius TaxID=51203 RepID=A0A285FXZ4_9EURY|nr:MULTISPECIES: protein translocase subunit SecF [Methanohalophilus]KXS44080.1 MAG: preprotein translocase subunit SecF [Methanohalophilus sp. T328-1]RSD34741.1 MAG: preprotein translocase subunit SecF [Methanohalophilus sp.]OBZ34562.1 MAG: preprotein translocase subunit SecF [Methanohalophilus sp. DAL1]ODV50311.1 MAG: preprotein translocase subunit SecF [Methanohalophilus sp. 2-GBenrich]PQV42836.1 protein translocase subunit secF [Methanohalophilus euhalobius]
MALFIDKLENFIKNHNERQLVTIPLAVFAIALLIMVFVYSTSGSPVNLGMEFKGGTMISFQTDDPIEKLEVDYSGYSLADVRKTGQRAVLQFGPMDNDEQLELEKKITSAYSSVEIRQVGAVYGKDLQVQALQAVVLSFIGMAIVVFLIFRSTIPSVAVVLSALSDISIAAAFMNITGIELSLGTVAALLMLIGYSVDSDILLTTRVLKRRGSANEKISLAMHTGITMTTTTLAALVVMYIVSTYSYVLTSTVSQINLLSDISIVLIFGLLADLMNTWLLNTGILRWYVNKNPKGVKT